MELAYRNAMVVTADDAFLGSVQVVHGKIMSVDRGPGGVGEDLEGDVLMPGVIDLHTDNLEKHFFPRPNIDWNPVSAVTLAARQLFGNTNPAMPVSGAWPMQHPIATSLLWSVLILIIFVPLATRLFQKAVSR